MIMRTKTPTLLAVMLVVLSWGLAPGFAHTQPVPGTYLWLKSGATATGQGGRYDHLRCDDRTDMKALLKELPGLRDLTRVTMREAAVKDDHLRILAESCQLVDLCIEHGKITDNGMKYLGKQKRLAMLPLNNNKIRDDGMQELHQLENLKSLSLYGTKITDVGLKDISRLKNLSGMTVPPLITEIGRA